jgi:hypothetical protein
LVYLGDGNFVLSNVMRWHFWSFLVQYLLSQQSLAQKSNKEIVHIRDACAMKKNLPLQTTLSVMVWG